MTQYPFDQGQSYHPQPSQYPLSQQPMQQPAEVFKTRCSQGKLIITTTHIIVERGNLRSASIPRQALTGIDLKLVLLFPFLSRSSLVFHGQGAERLKASMVKARDAKRVKRLLTGR